MRGMAVNSAGADGQRRRETAEVDGCRRFRRHRSSRYRHALWPTSQFYFCGIPLRLDTKPKCAFNCAYCFAMLRGGRRSANTSLASVSFIASKLDAAISHPRRANALEHMLCQHVPVHFGGISDPFSDGATRRSLDILAILLAHDYPVVISTKNPAPLLQVAGSGRLTKDHKVVIQVSLPGIKKSQVGACEPNAPRIEDRLALMRELSKAGFICQCRLQPLFWFDARYVAAHVIPLLADAGCRHVIVEHLKLPVERRTFGAGLRRMLSRLTWDAYEDYRQLRALCVGREWQLPAQFKWDNLRPIVAAIHSGNMTFGAGDYGLHHLGDTECCCGLDCYSGFEGWFRGSIPAIIRRAEIGRVGYPKHARLLFFPGNMRDVLNSKCRLENSDHEVSSYIRWKWNRPGTVNAPDQYLGVSGTDEIERNGMRVYYKVPIP
jgi:DNA repair photolyase